MIRGLLASPKYRPQFSGHETFPLRQLWLRKAYVAVSRHGLHAPKGVFGDDDAIARFGVGKNMVSAIRHWSLACDVIAEVPNGFQVGPIGTLLFGPNGLDPYLEHPASAWLIHWYLAGEGRRSTTWYWLFNHVVGPVFDRDDIGKGIRDYCEQAKVNRAAAATISRDVEVCMRSYAPRSNNETAEDLVEPVLAELGLISHLKGNEYTFRIGPKRNLPDGVLLFALSRYWNSLESGANTMSLDMLAFERGALGLVFKMDIDSLAERLMNIEQPSQGAYGWSETAGLKQIVRLQQNIDPFQFLEPAYVAPTDRRN